MTSHFEVLLTQLAQEHEREIAVLRKSIETFSRAGLRGTHMPQFMPPGDVLQSVCDGQEESPEDDAASHEGDAMRLGAKWVQVPPKFASQHGEDVVTDMNRRVAAHLTDEPSDISDVPLLSSKFVLDPGSTKRMVWDVFGMILIAYDLITIPMMLFSPADVTFTTFMSWLAMLFWTADMLASLNTGYRPSNGSVVMDRARIARQYFKTWLLIDLLVVVPDWTVTILNIVMGTNGGGDSETRTTRMLRVMRAIRIVRLLRIAKLKKLIQMVYDSIDSEYIFICVNLMQLILIILIMNHYVACVWYGIGELTRTQGSDTGLNWLEHTGRTPVFSQGLDWRYVTALHWSITQFTPASMDISAVNLPERVFSIAILFMSLVSLSSIIGSVTASMTQLRGLKGENTQKFWMLRRYLREKQTSWSLKDRILRYVEYQTEKSYKSTPASKVPLLTILSDPLKRELATCLYSPSLSEHPVFAYLAKHMPKMHEWTCESIRPSSYGDSDIVFRSNEAASFMYFLQSGTFDYRLSGSAHPRDPPLKAKEWLVEIALWAMTWRYRGDLMCREAGDLLLIDATKFADSMRLHPRSWHFGRAYGAKLVAHFSSMDQSSITDFTFDDQVSQMVNDSDVYDDMGSFRAAPPPAVTSFAANSIDSNPEVSSASPVKVMI